MRLVVFIGFTFLFVGSGAFACDPCALYNASRLQGHSAKTLTLSISEQYTDFDRAKDSVENSIRNGEFVRGFSTTQFSLSYDLSERFGVQATLPLVARRFDEVKQYRTSTKSDSGIGDATIAGTYSFLDYKSPDWMVISGITGGIKFPTGDTGVLEEVTTEEADHPMSSSILRHHQIGSTSGGRALTFGTGAYDYILGLNLLSRYQRYLLLANTQYTLRTEGDFNYEFSNDFLCSVGTGYYFFLEHEFSVAGLLSVSGEFKGKDHLSEELVKGSDVSNIYVGPQLLLTLNEQMSAELSLDVRVTDEDRDATVVPEARVRASLSYRF